MLLQNLIHSYHWIVRKFLKHEVKNVINVRWKRANDMLKEALIWNWENDEEVLDYLQETSSVCV